MNYNRSSLEIILGPMFSGKTSALITSLTRYADIGYSTLYINSSVDDREEGCYSTHSSSLTISKKITGLKTNSLSDIDVTTFHVIGIDEGQFFVGIFETVVRWLDLGKKIIISSLDGDSNKSVFGEVLRLIPHSDTTYKLQAVCLECRREFEREFEKIIDNLSLNNNTSTFHLAQPMAKAAPFTKRLCDSVEQTCSGGKDKFIPVCRYHHYNTNIVK